MNIVLMILFFITAALYASVGFGGGSTYNALLVMAGTDVLILPMVALACNITVVSGNVARYWRAGLLDFRRYVPLVILSIPMAFLGGSLPVSQKLFIGLLAAALLFAGARLLWTSFQKPAGDAGGESRIGPVSAALIGGAVGFYSGIVGIGGGIFLAPILHFARWGSGKAIAVACSFFILVNSASGLSGQGSKLADIGQLEAAYAYWPLLPTVLIGGLIGNYLGTFKFSESWIKRMTAILILVVALRLTLKWFTL
ncbi:MAG: sulfite exporter TauE/SafE family protein [Hellea sp.]|nr:sulfite exporter TauE/SafE family protein [Hellea sp.]